mmetsp:Transcript_112765/g.204953  ORF Transcript_112765/g.204953 Transcript_112765/m.204953 type:complete len:325 (+) Transcript_112765:75-1049(+)
MGRIALVLACIACTSHGRRTFHAPDVGSGQASDVDRANMFALLLSSLKPEVAFSSGLSIPAPKRSGHRALSPNMQMGKRLQYGAPQEVDMTIPQDGWPVPEEGCVLRNLKVVKTTPEGLFAEVDPSTGLQGYIFTSGLDTAYIKSASETFKVGDRIDAKMVGLGTTSGRVLLSRKLLIEDEGSEKHELPNDGRVLPKRTSPTPPREVEKPDPSIPTQGANVPESGSILRGAEIMSLEANGMYVMVEEASGLQAFVFKSLSDNWYVKEMDQTFKLGDRVDVKIKDVSPTSGRLMASRKEVMDEEGREKHQLPDDGRTPPIQPGSR